MRHLEVPTPPRRRDSGPPDDRDFTAVIGAILLVIAISLIVFGFSLLTAGLEGLRSLGMLVLLVGGVCVCVGAGVVVMRLIEVRSNRKR